MQGKTNQYRAIKEITEWSSNEIVRGWEKAARWKIRQAQRQPGGREGERTICFITCYCWEI